MEKQQIRKRILDFLEVPRTHVELTKYVSRLPIRLSEAGKWHDVWEDIINNNEVREFGLFPIYIQTQHKGCGQVENNHECFS